ncbi:MAG: DUF3192 domain-containing protein [Gemmatimonadota bacterium]|nr:DUF3192 domain-containing protein [Gemmatimonadota bacterium]
MQSLRSHAIPLVLALAGLSACVTAGNFRERNRERLDHLRVGMTRAQVLDLFGTGTVRVPEDETAQSVRFAEDTLGVTRVELPVGGGRRTLTNPHRSQTWLTESGEWEVLYYYTRLLEDDGRVGDEELTPVVLRDGTVVGWGWSFWTDEIRRHDLPAPLPERDGEPEAFPSPVIPPRESPRSRP